MPDLLATDGVVPTGISAADSYSLGLASGGAADAYVSGDTAQRLVANFYLIDGPQGNPTLRMLDIRGLTATRITERGSSNVTFTIHTAPRLIAGADLANDGDARTRAAGCPLINDALRATKPG